MTNGNEPEWHSAADSADLVRAMGFQAQETTEALARLRRSRERIAPSGELVAGGSVVVYSGHMIDASHRAVPRLPPDKEPVAAAAIEQVLDELGAGPDDLAIGGAACGADLLFAEGLLRRAARLVVQLPRQEAEFLQESVDFAGRRWRQRYFAVKDHPRTIMLVMPDELGTTAEGAASHARNNLWMLYNALCFGPERVRLVSLWNGQGGDAPGGTRDMIDRAVRLGIKCRIIKTTDLW